LDGDQFISNPLNFARVGASLVGSPPLPPSSPPSAQTKAAAAESVSSSSSSLWSSPPSSTSTSTSAQQQHHHPAAGEWGPIYAQKPRSKGSQTSNAGADKFGAISTGTFMAFFFGMRMVKRIKKKGEHPQF
jgi:hypothetical protein